MEHDFITIAKLLNVQRIPVGNFPNQQGLGLGLLNYFHRFVSRVIALGTHEVHHVTPPNSYYIYTI